jgi:hypothetical protein
MDYEKREKGKGKGKGSGNRDGGKGHDKGSAGGRQKKYTPWVACKKCYDWAFTYNLHWECKGCKITFLEHATGSSKAALSEKAKNESGASPTEPATPPAGVPADFINMLAKLLSVAKGQALPEAVKQQVAALDTAVTSAKESMSTQAPTHGELQGKVLQLDKDVRRLQAAEKRLQERKIKLAKELEDTSTELTATSDKLAKSTADYRENLHRLQVLHNGDAASTPAGGKAAEGGGGGPPSGKGSSGNSMDEHWRSVARSEIKKAATEQYRKRVADFSAKRRKTAGGTQKAKEDEDDGEDDLFGDDLDAEMEALTEAAMAAIPKSRF